MSTINTDNVATHGGVTARYQVIGGETVVLAIFDDREKKWKYYGDPDMRGSHWVNLVADWHRGKKDAEKPATQQGPGNPQTALL